MPTYRLDFGYDGTGFHGFARQRGVRTVQGDLEEALAKVMRQPVETVGAGRTDAGVHARQQVVSFTSDRVVDPRRIVRAVTSMLGPEMVAFDAAEVDAGFSARFSAVWRSYRYQVLNAPQPDPLRRHTTWHLSDPLDLARMNRAAGMFVGAHDFASFCRRRSGASTERTVYRSTWEREADMKVYSIRAGAFCHQMVRSLVGFLVDVGRGRADPDSVPHVLAAADRHASRPMAPPHGLVLWEVGYESSAGDP